MNKIFSCIGLFALSVSAFFSASAYDAVFDLPGEESTCIGILIRDISSGEIIADVASEKNYVPASVMKSITTASALSLLPKDFQFETRFDALGTFNADSTVFNGNIIVQSCGDPTFDSEEFPEYAGSVDSVIVSLQRIGVKKINGSVIINQTMSEEGPIVQWEIDDVAWGYGAGLFGMNFKDNTFRLWPATGKTDPEVPGLELVKIPTADSNNLVRGIGSDKLYVYSNKLRDRKYSMRSTMPDPAAVYANMLVTKLRDAGISVSAKSSKVASDAPQFTFYVHKSPQLIDILGNLMVHSNNLFAEGILRAIAPGEDRSKAIEKCRELWQERGIESRYVTIRDGSGLARVDRLSPRFITEVLTFMATSEMASDYVGCFPVAGVNGTVKKLLAKTPLEGKFAMKSGSMNGVLCYAGYKLDEEGTPTHTVVVLVNSYFCTSSQLREKIEKYLLDVFPQTDQENE